MLCKVNFGCFNPERGFLVVQFLFGEVQKAFKHRENKHAPRITQDFVAFNDYHADFIEVQTFFTVYTGYLALSGQ